MRRAVLVLATVMAALAVIVVVARGRGGDDVVARVGEQEISESALAHTVDGVNAELAAEGRELAPAGSEGERRLRASALALLVYRARIEQGAARLGIEVSLDEARARLGGANTGDESEEGGAGALGAVRTQLLYERVFARVTRGIVVTPAEVAAHRRAGVDDKTILREVLSNRRQAAMRAWLSRTEKTFPVREAG